MKMYTSVLIILLLMIAIPDTFFYLKLKSRDMKPVFIFIHLFVAVTFAAIFLYLKFELENLRNFRIVAAIVWLYFVFLIIYIPKLIHIVFYLLNLFYRRIFHRDSMYLTMIRVGLTIFVVLTMFISAYITPRRFDVCVVQVPIENLPPAFDGYRIVQLSDIHLGSWNKKFDRLKPVIRLVNRQHPDIIVFTGDIVNNFADEAAGWKPLFIQMHSKNGKYAVLGNHDYGDYVDWSSSGERIKNRNEIRQTIRDFGFHLLLNENVWLRKDNDSLMLVGVENWGKTRAYRYSDLNKALSDAPPKAIKILLTHDPSQWDQEIVGKEDIKLTLSGHTHAAQLGIRFGRKLLSPASFAFKYWAGLYQIENQYLYVNRGIGYIGLPMHIGVRPEITVIILKRK